MLSEALTDSGGAPSRVALKPISDYERIGELADCTDDAFVSLNSAFIGDGIFVEIDEDVNSEKTYSHRVRHNEVGSGTEGCIPEDRGCHPHGWQGNAD